MENFWHTENGQVSPSNLSGAVLNDAVRDPLAGAILAIPAAVGAVRVPSLAEILPAVSPATSPGRC